MHSDTANAKARSHEAGSDFEAAYSEYKSVLGQWPDDFTALMGAGRSAFKCGRRGEAEGFFSRAAEVSPHRVSPFIRLGHVQQGNDPMAALQTYQAGLARHPNDERLKELETLAQLSVHRATARRHYEAEEYAKAAAAYDAILDRAPTDYAALMGAGLAALKANDPARAEEFFTRACDVEPYQPHPFIKLGRLQARTNLPVAHKTILRGRDRFPENTQLQDLLTISEINLGSGNTIDIDKELAAPTLSEAALVAEIRKRRPRDPASQTARRYGRLAELFPKDQTRLRHAEELLRQRCFAEATVALSQMDNPTLPTAMMYQAVCNAALGDRDEARQALEQFADSEVDDHTVLRTCIAFLDASPDLGVAVQILEDLNRSVDDPSLDHLIEFARQIRPPERALMTGDVRDDVVRLSEPGTSGAMVLAFTGYGLATGGVPFSLIDRFLAGHGIGAGTLFDPSATLFWNGLPSFGDTLDATIGALKETLSAKDVSRIYTVGISGGGVGAMVYGCRLGASRALTFSGPTDLRLKFLRDGGDRRAQAVIHALNKRLPEEHLNLRGWLEAQHNRCAIDAYYCEKEARDAAQAQNIAHLPDVSLYPVGRFDTHGSIVAALGTGALLTAFTKIVSEIADA